MSVILGAVSIAIGEAAGKAVLDECNDPKYQSKSYYILYM